MNITFVWIACVLGFLVLTWYEKRAGKQKPVAPGTVARRVRAGIRKALKEVLLVAAVIYSGLFWAGLVLQHVSGGASYEELKRLHGHLTAFKAAFGQASVLFSAGVVGGLLLAFALSEKRIFKICQLWSTLRASPAGKKLWPEMPANPTDEKLNDKMVSIEQKLQNQSGIEAVTP